VYLKKMSRRQSTHWTSGVFSFSQPRQGIPHERSKPRPDSGWEGWWAKVRKCPTLQMPVSNARTSHPSVQVLTLFVICALGQ